MGNMTKVTVVAVGVVTLHFDGGKELILQDCLYAPSVRRNLISVPSLACNGFLVLFNKNSIFIKRNDDVICCGSLIDNLYLVDPTTSFQINSNESNHKRKNVPQLTKPNFGTLD